MRNSNDARSFGCARRRVLSDDSGGKTCWKKQHLKKTLNVGEEGPGECREGHFHKRLSNSVAHSSKRSSNKPLRTPSRQQTPMAWDRNSPRLSPGFPTTHAIASSLDSGQRTTGPPLRASSPVSSLVATYSAFHELVSRLHAATQGASWAILAHRDHRSSPASRLN